MSFFDDASLAFLPSGAAGKDGKAYSIKPTDGTGDFTFSRGSNLAATRVGADGLIEKGRENLFLQSNQFDTTWLQNRINLTSGQSGYDGGSNAWQLQSNDASTTYLEQSVSASGVQTASIYAKVGTADYLAFYASSGARAWFNLNSGSISSSFSNIDTQIENVGNGWYRCSMSYDASTTYVRIYVTDVDGNFTSAIGANIYIQDAQLEIGLAATDVISTGATTGKAGLLEDEPRFDYSGGATCPSLLLEPSRTQLLKYSEYFGGWNNINQGTGIAPTLSIGGDFPLGDGKYYNLQCDLNGGTTSNDRSYISLGGLSGTQFTAAKSLWIKNNLASEVTLFAGINFSSDGFTLAANEDWQRITIEGGVINTEFRIGLGGGASNSDSIDVSIYGAQCEEGSYPTSYIPNHSGTGSVTRGFDYSIVESLGYSSTYTFYYEFNTTTGRETSSPFAEIGKDQSNKIWIKGASANGPQFSVQGNGIFSGSISPTNEVSGTNKIAVQWSSGVGVVFSNGVKQSGTLTNSNTSENIDFISAKGEGTSHDSKQLLFFEEALSDADCITLTTL